MSEVGIRALKQNASAVVAAAAGGDVVTITDRGRPVARMTPIASSRLAELIESGRARPPPVVRSPRCRRLPRGRASPKPSPRCEMTIASDVAHYLDTSALVKLVVAEPETEALRAWLLEADRDPVGCDLVRTELLRTVRRAAPDRVVDARRRARRDHVGRGDVRCVRSRWRVSTRQHCEPSMRCIWLRHWISATTSTGWSPTTIGSHQLLEFCGVRPRDRPALTWTLHVIDHPSVAAGRAIRGIRSVTGVRRRRASARRAGDTAASDRAARADGRTTASTSSSAAGTVAPRAPRATRGR